MANKFTITISAVDNATKTVNRINRQMANMLMPVTKLKRSLSNFGNALGLPKIQKKLTGVAKAAGGMAEKVGKIIAPMAALIGVGTLGGIAALATEWAKLGFEITNTAANLGLSTGQLQTLRGAAGLAGVSAGELDGSMKALGDTLEGAQFGRNQGALMMMSRLGISLKRTKEGSVDTEAALMDLASVMQRPGIKGNAQVQGLIADTFGVGALLPLLRKGPQAIAAYQAKVRELGGEMSGPAVAAAEAFEERMLYLHAAVGGLKNSIGGALMPALSPLVEQLTNWIARNRELIASKVGEWARQFAAWVEKIDFKQVLADITSFVKRVAELIDQFGGLKTIAIVLGGVLTASALAPVLSLTAAMVSLGSTLVGVAAGLTGVSAAAGAAALAVTGVGLAAAVGIAGGSAFNSWYASKTGGSSVGSDVYDIAHNNGQAGGPDQTGSTKGIVDFFMSKGWSRAQALGLAANEKAESGYNTSAVGDHGHSYGIGQWSDRGGVNSRQADFARRYGHDIHSSTLAEQLDFQNFELTEGKEQAAGNRLRQQTTQAASAEILSRYAFRPAAVEEAAKNRAALANDLDVVDTQQRAAAARSQQAAGAPDDSGASSDQAMMKVALDIHLHNLPAGAGATVKPRDDSDFLGPTKVNYPMPSAGL